MAKKLELIELGVSDLDSPTPAVNRTALVDQPAIEEGWMIFGKSLMEFKTASVERRLVMGPAMIPDIPIYRKDDYGEYNCIFRKDTIEKIMKKMGMGGFHNQFNIMHDPMRPTNGVFLFEIMMVDKERGIKTPSVFGKEFNDGTMIMTLFIKDDVTWEEYVKTGRLTGFSVEGFFSMLFRKETSDASNLEKCITDWASGFSKGKVTT